MKKEKGVVQLYTPEGEAWRGGDTNAIPWQSYPRPHLRRESFLCLNGWWDFATLSRGEKTPIYDRRIRVPFVPQSPLSGIGEILPDEARLCYRRTFEQVGS